MLKISKQLLSMKIFNKEQQEQFCFEIWYLNNGGKTTRRN